MDNPRGRATPGTTDSTGWPSSAVVVTRPVVLVRAACELPHTCPECGCSWGEDPDD